MLKRVNRKLSQKGFTLIELMIVVAIIGILAAIAIPNFRAYQLKAKRGELPTNLKAIKTAEVAFQAERDRFQALTASPRGLNAVDGTKQAWTDNNGFANIGWQPSGAVYGAYATSTASASACRGNAQSDIDGDNTNANYAFQVDVSSPGNDMDVTMRSGANVF